MKRHWDLLEVTKVTDILIALALHCLQFVLKHALPNDKSVVKYHERVQKLAPWFIESKCSCSCLGVVDWPKSSYRSVSNASINQIKVLSRVCACLLLL